MHKAKTSQSPAHHAFSYQPPQDGGRSAEIFGIAKRWGSNPCARHSTQWRIGCQGRRFIALRDRFQNALVAGPTRTIPHVIIIQPALLPRKVIPSSRRISSLLSMVESTGIERRRFVCRCRDHQGLDFPIGSCPSQQASTIDYPHESPPGTPDGGLRYRQTPQSSDTSGRATKRTYHESCCYGGLGV